MALISIALRSSLSPQLVAETLDPPVFVSQRTIAVFRLQQRAVDVHDVLIIARDRTSERDEFAKLTSAAHFLRTQLKPGNKDVLLLTFVRIERELFSAGDCARIPRQGI